jgi:double-stranded uracil-DNA glycosylase
MGFTRQELEAHRDEPVPDLIRDDVRLLFVGINPGLWTAASGAHFAHPGNRFYKALHGAGILPEVLDVADGYTPEHRSALLDRGIGITNLASRATARADELDADELRRGAERLERVVGRRRPGVVAFVGITAYRTAFDRPAAAVGEADETIAGASVWVLPNPSGLNAHYQLPDLARLYRQAAQSAGLVLADPPIEYGDQS